MSDLLAERVLLFAGEAFAASALVMALAWLGAGAKRASLRHLVWAAAFGALIVLPLLALLVPGAVVFTLAAPAVPPALAADLTATTMTPPPPESFSFSMDDAAYALIAVWLAGVVLIALRHALAAFLLHRLRRDSDEHPFDASELPPGRYDLRLSRGAHGPLTWGVLRPVVLLPNAAQFWPHERLQAVLRHESAHVARRDGLSQLLACVTCALYWPNPLVWLGARALRREAEIAADDAVIASGMTPSDYAGELLAMARAFRGDGLAAALSMAAPSALPARVKSILAATSSRSGVTSMDVLKMAAIAVLTAGALVAARPSLAQDAPSPPPAAEATPAATPIPPVPPVPPMDVEAPPAPPAGVDSPDQVVRIIRLDDTHHGHAMQRVQSEIVMTGPDMHDAMARVAPDIARAMADFKAHEAEVRRIEAMRPQLNAEIKQALAEARAQIALVSDEAIRAKAEAALARAQAGIDRAAEGEFHHHGHTIIMRDGDGAK